jgi:uncharacterized protein YecE (DUF72 family)
MCDREAVDTFYRTPAISTVRGWYAKTPPGFIFAAKVPQVITHEKVLVAATPIRVIKIRKYCFLVIALGTFRNVFDQLKKLERLTRQMRRMFNDSEIATY